MSRAKLPVAVAGFDILKNVPLFSDLDDAELALVAEASRRLRFPKGSIVFHEGDRADYLLVIAKGRVKVTLLEDSGEETIVNLLEPLMVVVLGLIVGFIVIALFMPLVELLNKLS